VNRYTAAGVLADMRAGKHILFLSAGSNRARYALDDLAALLEPGERAYRSLGRERIVGATGTIRFQSIHSRSERGMSADIVVIDADANDHWERVDELSRTMYRIGGGHSEIIRWT
jgi:hypothetical protein